MGYGGPAGAVGNDAGIDRSGGAAAFEQGGVGDSAVGNVLGAVEEALAAELGACGKVASEPARSKALPSCGDHSAPASAVAARSAARE